MKAPALVLVTTSFPIRGDGSEAAGSFVSDLAEELARHGPVRVVAPGTADIHEHWSPGVEVFRFAAPDQPLSTLKPWRLADLKAICKVLGAGERATRNAVRAGPTGRIVALWALPSGHWARRIGREASVPYVVWTLGSDIWTLGRVPLLRGYLRIVLRDAEACYSDGIALAEDTRRIGGRPVAFLPSTRRIESTRQNPPRTAPPYRLLFLGRWHRNKGIDLLLDALASLGDADWQHIESVKIAGGGPLADQVSAAVGSLQALGRPVHLHGYLDKAHAEAALARTDFLLLPSRIESIPVVFSDAIKLGCPVLATPVGDLPRLITGPPRCGFVAASVDAQGIAKLMSGALMGSAAQFSQGLRERASTFDIGSIATRLTDGIGSGDG